MLEAWPLTVMTRRGQECSSPPPCPKERAKPGRDVASLSFPVSLFDLSKVPSFRHAVCYFSSVLTLLGVPGLASVDLENSPPCVRNSPTSVRTRCRGEVSRPLKGRIRGHSGINVDTLISEQKVLNIVSFVTFARGGLPAGLTLHFPSPFHA